MSRALLVVITLALVALAGLGCVEEPDLERALWSCTVPDDCLEGFSCAKGVCVDRDRQGAADASGGDSSPASPRTFADLKSDECPEVYGVGEREVVDNSVVLFGTLLPLSGPLAAYGEHMEMAVKMGADEVNGIGGIGGGRKIALLCCDSGTDKAVSVAAAEHLASTGLVGGIIGPADASNVIEVYTKVAQAADVMMITPAATSAAITSLDAEDDLIWRTVPGDEHQAAALAALVEHLGYRKVGVLNRGDAYGSEFEKAFHRALCSSSQTRKCDGTDYLASDFDPGNPADDLPEAVAALTGFAPDVTVLITFPTNGLNIMNAAADKGFKRFLLTDGMRDRWTIESVFDMEVKCRAVGTVPAIPPSDALNAFYDRYRVKWGQQPATFSANSYDAFYLLAYAAAAAVAGVNEEDLPVTGSQLSAAMKRLSSQREVPAGTEDWNTAVHILRSDSTAEIDYEGISGPLDFAPSTGEAIGAMAVWRFHPSSDTIANLGIIRTATGLFIPPDGVPGHPDPPCAPYNDGGTGGGP